MTAHRASGSNSFRRFWEQFSINLSYKVFSIFFETYSSAVLSYGAWVRSGDSDRELALLELLLIILTFKVTNLLCGKGFPVDRRHVADTASTSSRLCGASVYVSRFLTVVHIVFGEV
jgi:hypothetical protein